MRTLLLLLGCAVPALAEPLERLLPETTLLYAGVTDAPATRARFTRSPLDALWSDPGVQRFLQKPLRRWHAAVERACGSLGARPEELFAASEGAFALAVTAYDAPTRTVQGVVLAEMSPERARSFLARCDGERAVYAQGILAVATSRETLDAMRRRLRDPTLPALAGHEAYRRASERSAGHADVTIYLNHHGLLRALGREGGPLADERRRAYVEALGLASIEAVVYRGTIEPEGLISRLFVSIPDGRSGLLKALDAENRPLLPPAFVGGDVAAVSTVVLDFGALVAELVAAAERIRPGSAARFERAVERMKRLTGVDLRADVLGALGPRVTWYTRSGAGAGAGAGTPSLLVALEVREAQRLGRAVTTLVDIGMMKGTLREEDFRGVKIYRVARGLRWPLAFALLPGRLLVGLDPEDVRAVVERMGRQGSVRASEDFARGLRWIPEGRIFVSFSREAQALRRSFLLGLFPDLFDMRLWPGEVLARHLDVGAGSVVNEERGVLFTGRIAFRPQATGAADR